MMLVMTICELSVRGYFTSQRVKSPEQHKYMDYDKNGFRVISDLYHVTHWKPIDKLEE